MAITNAGMGSISAVAAPGPAHISDTDTAYGAGKIHSFLTDAVEKAYVDFEGSYHGRHILPTVSDAYDLGANGNWWKKAWVSELSANGTGTFALAWRFTGDANVSGSFTIQDDVELKFGNGRDLWMKYNAAGTAFEFWSTTGGGGAADGLIFSVQDGGDDIVFAGGVTATTGTFGGDVVVSNGFGAVVGHTALLQIADATPEFQVLGTATNDSVIGLGRWSADTVSAGLRFYKNRNAAIGSDTIVVTGDDLGSIEGYGYDGVDPDTLSSQILLSTEGTIGANRIPGRILFRTATDAAPGVLTTALTLDSAQGATIAGAGRVIGNFDVNTNKFTVNATSGDTVIAGEATIHTITVGLGNNAIASNTACGLDALAGITNGTDNVGLGKNALKATTTGVANMAIGFSALVLNQGGGSNAGIGAFSLPSNVTGSNNTALGYAAGYLATGTGSVFLGFYAGAYEVGGSAFYVDALNRVNTAGDKAGAILYGVFDATPANQTLTINADLTVSGTGPHVFGGAVVDYVQVLHTGAFTSGGASDHAVGLKLMTTLEGDAGDSDFVAQLAVTDGTIEINGNAAVVASAYFAEPVITETAGNAAIAATVYIKDAPDEGAVNYALNVAAGATKIAGNMGFFGTEPVSQLLKANFNNWAAFGDVVDALVSIGLFDAA